MEPIFFNFGSVFLLNNDLLPQDVKPDGDEAPECVEEDWRGFETGTSHDAIQFGRIFDKDRNKTWKRVVWYFWWRGQNIGWICTMRLDRYVNIPPIAALNGLISESETLPCVFTATSSKSTPRSPTATWWSWTGRRLPWRTVKISRSGPQTTQLEQWEVARAKLARSHEQLLDRSSTQVHCTLYSPVHYKTNHSTVWCITVQYSYRTLQKNTVYLNIYPMQLHDALGGLVTDQTDSFLMTGQPLEVTNVWLTITLSA